MKTYTVTHCRWFYSDISRKTCVCLMSIAAALLCTATSGADTASVSIRVIDALDAKPLPGATVSTGKYCGLSGNTIGRTDSAGQCTCSVRPLVLEPSNSTPAVHIMQCDVWIQFAGYVSQHVDLLSNNARKSSGDSGPLIVRMVRGRVLSGSLVLPDGSPVAFEPVLLVGNTDTWPIQYETKTDQQGRFHWNEAPQGTIFIAMGVDKIASSSVFKELVVSDAGTIVEVPLNWRGSAGKSDSRMVYLRRSSDAPVLPTTSVEGRAWALMSMLELAPDPVNHIILSFSNSRATADFFAVGGNDDKVRLRGEVQISGHHSGPAAVGGENDGETNSKEEQDGKEKGRKEVSHIAPRSLDNEEARSPNARQPGLQRDEP